MTAETDDTEPLPRVIVMHDAPPARSADGDDLSPIKISLYEDGEVTLEQDDDFMQLTARQRDILIEALQATQKTWAAQQGNSPATEPSA